jgi:hypothetical protein
MLSIVSLDGVGDDAPEVPVLRTVMPPERKKRNAGFNRGGDRSIIDDASGNVAMATQADRVTRNSRIMVQNEVGNGKVCETHSTFELVTDFPIESNSNHCS